MANSLNKNLNTGDRIELNDGRIVTCKGGFGAVSFTSGTALFIEHNNGKRERVSGYDIKHIVERIPV